MTDHGISLPAAVGILFFLLLLSAFFSGSETALTRARRARLRVLEKAGSESARRANRLLDQPEWMLSGILLGNNFVNIAASSLATAMLVGAYGEVGVIYATAAMTVLILVFAEILPKTVAVTHAERVACKVSGTMWWILRILGPVISVLMALIHGLQSILGVSKERQQELTQAELATMIDIGAETGVLDKAREQMLTNSLKLHEVQVKALMTPRSEMALINAEQTVSECLKQAIAQPHSRYPVHHGEPDNLIGIVHLRDLVRLANSPLSLADAFIWQTPPYVPATKSALAQLFDFQIRRQHLAIVVDERGDIDGLITLEDILEEIVGDIVDESDAPQASQIWPQVDGSYVVAGNVSLHDINQAMDVDLPEEAATTINGLILEQIGEQPEGELSLKLNGMHIEA
ncbi:MAG: CNNM domain-containing protein, partial [Mariprofundaceae bacterium]